VECGRKAGLSMLEQEMEATVGVLGRAKAGEHPHGPGLAAVHGFVDAARVWELARRAGFGCQVRDISGSIDGLEGDAASGLPALRCRLRLLARLCHGRLLLERRKHRMLLDEPDQDPHLCSSGLSLTFRLVWLT